MACRRGAVAAEGEPFGLSETPAGIGSNEGRVELLVVASARGSRAAAKSSVQRTDRGRCTGVRRRSIALRDREAPLAGGAPPAKRSMLDPEREHLLAHAQVAERVDEHVVAAGRGCGR